MSIQSTHLPHLAARGRAVERGAGAAALSNAEQGRPALQDRGEDGIGSTAGGKCNTSSNGRSTTLLLPPGPGLCFTGRHRDALTLGAALQGSEMAAGQGQGGLAAGRGESGLIGDRKAPVVLATAAMVSAMAPETQAGSAAASARRSTRGVLLIRRPAHRPSSELPHALTRFRRPGPAPRAHRPAAQLWSDAGERRSRTRENDR